MSRRFLLAIAVLLGLLLAIGPGAGSRVVAQPVPTVPDEVVLTLFWGDGCPHCAAEKRFLEELQQRFPDLTIETYEVWYDQANRALFRERAAAAGVDAGAVPTTFLADRVWIGYAESVGEEIEAVVAALLAGRTAPEAEPSTVDVPFVGEVELGGRSMLLSTVLIGFVDGVNPCSLWVLSVLLAVVLHSGSRRRVIAVGGMFLLVTSAMYGLYIVGAYSVLSYVEYMTWTRVAVALVAGTLGLLQLKDVVAFHRGPTLGVPDKAKPAMYQRMRHVAAPDRPWPVVLGATAVLAVGVSLLETPCTLGLPVLWTNLLNQNDVPPAGAVLLFLVYLSVFLIDELAVFVAVVATMRAVKMQERHGRELKLISGVTMVTLAVAMIIAPSSMESLTGAATVFAIAALVAVTGLIVDGTVRPRLQRHA